MAESDDRRAGSDAQPPPKGILMERYKLTADQAFDLLVRTSRHTTIKLAEVARRLVETGELAVRERS
jgi:ANTAR domain